MEQEQIVQKITALEGSMKTIYNEVADVKVEVKEIKTDNKILHEMNTNIAVMTSNMKNMGDEIKTVQSDVKELKEKPAKRWNTLETVIITALASGLIGFGLSKIFGG